MVNPFLLLYAPIYSIHKLQLFNLREVIMGQFIIRAFGVIGITVVVASVAASLVAVATRSSNRR